MANYAREKSRYGGYTGSILVHSTPGLGSTNDPSSAIFKENLPAGYLKCDGSILNAKDYLALSQVLGVGDACRFAKEGAILRNPDENTGDLGSFQLPDLGSKVIIGGRATGTYNNDIIEADVVTTTRPVNRVGPQIDVSSNVGNRVEASFIGNMTLAESGEINMLGSPKYIVDRKTSQTSLDIENFQGHAHNSSQRYLNYSASHQVGGEGGKDSGRFSANSGAGNIFEETNNGGGTSIHQHNITRPFVYSHDFLYTYPQVSVDMTGVSAYIDVELSEEQKLDQLVTPFILVEYIIKF
jgi:hypothetical protein